MGKAGLRITTVLFTKVLKYDKNYAAKKENIKIYIS